LENAYLGRRVRTGSDDGGDREEGGQRRVWVDFNALDAEGCWVSGGERAVCPYGTGSGFDVTSCFPPLYM
jgi:hypothetical protein